MCSRVPNNGLRQSTSPNHACSQCQLHYPLLHMKIHQVAAQLYTVREFAKTPSDIAQTLKKIRAIGYQAVEVSGIGPITEDALAALLKKEGLTCCATHESGSVILNDPLGAGLSSA